MDRSSVDTAPTSCSAMHTAETESWTDLAVFEDKPDGELSTVGQRPDIPLQNVTAFPCIRDESHHVSPRIFHVYHMRQVRIDGIIAWVENNDNGRHLGEGQAANMMRGEGRMIHIECNHIKLVVPVGGPQSRPRQCMCEGYGCGERGSQGGVIVLNVQVVGDLFWGKVWQR